MTAENQDFTMRKGDTKILEFTVKDSAGTVVDITGATGKWEAALSRESTSKNIAKSGVSPSDPTNGKIQFTIDPADTSSLAARKYFHEAEITDSSSRVITIAEGKMTLVQDLI